MKKPELLAPGGSLEKLKTAIDYGADAVYLAGTSFGMRSFAGNCTMESMILLVAMIAVFYFLIIRPENKRKKQAENMRNSLKRGERITTIGGMVGRIVQVNDTTVVFETSEDRVRIEIAKWGIQSTESMEAAASKGKKAAAPAKKEEETASEPAPAKAEEPAAAEKEEAKSYNPEIK